MDRHKLIDAAGTHHQPAPSGARIVSLVPSLTELLFDMDLGRQVVGRTSYCIHPKSEVEAIPSVGGTKKISLSKLRALNADYVLMNIDENPKAMAAEISKLGIEVVVSHPKSVSDNLALFDLIGSIFSRTERAKELQRQFSNIHKSLSSSHATNPMRRVVYIIWREPWMTISRDTYIADMLSQVNWQAIEINQSQRYPEFSFSNLDLDSIDLVLFSSEPFAFDPSHIAEFAHSFPDHADKAFLIDGEMVSWYGSRAIPALRYLNTFARDVVS